MIYCPNNHHYDNTNNTIRSNTDNVNIKRDINVNHINYNLCLLSLLVGLVSLLVLTLLLVSDTALRTKSGYV